MVENVFKLMGLPRLSWETGGSEKLDQPLQVFQGNKLVAELGLVSASELKRFDIKQPVYYADLRWEILLELVQEQKLKFTELPKQLPVYRDLAMIVPASLAFVMVDNTVKKLRLDKLRELKLFDIFESDKLGRDKKSLAISFTFLDNEKTLTDKEIDAMMQKIMTSLEKELNAEIRKQ